MEMVEKILCIHMVYGADGNVFPNDDHDKPQKALLKVFLPISSDRSINWPMVVEVVELWGLGIYHCSFLPAESKSMRCL